MTDSTTDSEKVEEFLRILAVHDARLRCYVMSLVPQRADADEIMQEVNVVLWQKFSQFQVDTNFFAWACQIARFKVKDFRRKRARDRVIFSDDLVDLLAEEDVAVADRIDDCQVALDGCLERLKPNQRSLIQQRFNEDQPINEIAASLGVTGAAIYKSLGRTLQLLQDCIKRRMGSGKP